jgi:hypothetical protein
MEDVIRKEFPTARPGARMAIDWLDRNAPRSA